MQVRSKIKGKINFEKEDGRLMDLDVYKMK